MRETRILMGMPVTIEIINPDLIRTKRAIEKIFDYFGYIDKKFSTYKEDSEITLFNKGKVKREDFSDDMKEIFRLAEETEKETDGYFNIFHNGHYDPSGIAKGWGIYNAAKILEKDGFENFYVDAGGDIQVKGNNKENKKWTIGIQNPFNLKEIVKVITLSNEGVATSGTYIRGQHIYNPKNGDSVSEIVSLTVIGPNIYEADRFATAAFAMGRKGIVFIESLNGFEGYAIDKDKIGTFTSGFDKYLKNYDRKN